MDLGLQRIVQVDDANVQELTFQHVWDISTILVESQWKELGVDFEGRPDTDWRATVENYWNSLSDDMRQDFGKLVLSTSGRLASSQQDADEKFQAALRKLFPGTELQSMSLTEWRSRSTILIEEAKTVNTLFLFDLHFDRETLQRGHGMQLLRESKDYEHVTLGILSHAPSVENEPQAWEEISAEAGVPKDRFVVLSKARMSTDDPALLLDGFRRTVLHQEIERLKNTCRQILDPSIEKATRDIGEINVYDFDQAIFRSSGIEGVWEGDTYFRLFNATVRRHAQKAMHSSTTLRDHITQIRQKFPASEIVDPSVVRRAWRLHRNEIYEDHQFVNQHCLPTSNGDIFRVSGHQGAKDREYVLVCQPCDLVVRPRGERVFDCGLTRMGFWLEVSALGGDSLKSTDFELPYYHEDARHSWRLRLGRIHYVWLAALDLCALNVDGNAQIVLDKDSEQPLLLPGWQARVKLIQKLFIKSLAALSKVELDAQVRKTLAVDLLPSPCQSVKVSVTYDETQGARTLTMGIQRVGRLAPEWAAAILGRVAAHMSRPAFEHDLARDKDTVV